MGKKERRKLSNVNTAHSNKILELSSRNAVLIEPLLARFDSPNADFFALVTQSVDRHRLRIFDTHTGTVNNDFSSESEEKFNCLTWGKIDLNKKVDTPSPKKKKRFSSEIEQCIKVIALGSQTGSVIIYSISHGSVIKTLNGTHTSPVNDFVFTKDGKRGFSCGEDMSIVEWNIDNETVISKWNIGSQMTNFKLALSHDETKLLSVGHNMKMWDLRSKQVLKTFTGHATRITNVMFSAKDEIFITSAEHDRFINIWKCQGEDSDNGNPDALTLDENITNLSISKVNTVLAVSEAGILYIFKDTTSSLSTDTTLQNKKKKRVTTRTAEGQIKFLDEDDADIIPILSACFVDEEENKELGYIMVAIGSTVKPIFDKVQFNKNVGTSFQDITIKRHRPTGFLIDESNLAARNLQETQKLYDDSKVKVIGTKNYELPKTTTSEDEDLEDINKDNILSADIKDLDMVDFENNSSQKPEEQQHKFKKSTGHSMQQMLVQALHSNDKQLLLIVLEQTDPDIINNTVKKLQTKYVVSFLEKAITRFQEKPNTGMHILQWIKAVLLFHMAYLMTVPDLTRKLSKFYQTLDARVMIFQKLLNFQGRLDLVMQQVSMCQQDVKSTSNEPILSYTESSDEDDSDDDEDEEKDSEMEETDQEHDGVFINRDLDNGHLKDDENESEDEDEEMGDAVNDDDDDDNENLEDEENEEGLAKDHHNNKKIDSEDNEDDRNVINNDMDIDCESNNEDDDEEDNEGDETEDNDENDDDNDEEDQIEANGDDDDYQDEEEKGFNKSGSEDDV
ncbi:WD40-repeat-containing domain protein [Glomus cerebriforme]|uniref:WD40-repeat-containing domain protein n=1 Tax=Glomus cerebriforme TaxID=658196 RepID=A0A397TBW9_9GLOM|nr:WD40-repeat-containing domain protein [Glomus cerebriforme]